MTGYTPTIGLEIHAELKTATKMFCQSRNDPDEERPNHNVCPVCMAHPGTLPVVNREAVRHVLRVGAAVNGELADYTEFDRKNYFYPDIPKGYQISQYEFPLVKGGTLAGVELTRIHLEEDTATSRHEGSHSFVDFNRAGVPLMELVTEPVMHDAETAGKFARELQLLLRTLGAGEANMEKGQMRVEVNISLSRDDTLGTKVEIKNINSFRSVERAIAFEIKRQTEVLESGGTLVQETRGFNENTGETFSQRLKESSHDYRYFPDPDIPKFKLSLVPEFSNGSISASLPELPWVKRERLLAAGFDEEMASIAVSDVGESYTEGILAIEDTQARKIAANAFFTSVRSLNPSQVELTRVMDALPVFGRMRASGVISATVGMAGLAEVMKSGTTFENAVEGKSQISDSLEIARIAEKLIQDNAEVAAQIRAGKLDAMKFLIGQGMKLSKGQANPEMLAAELERLLS